MASTAKTASDKPRKSPLRADTVSRTIRGAAFDADPGSRGAKHGSGKLSATDLRQMAISEFAAWLREQTNKLDRPFQEHTLTSYTDAAKTLDRWMTAEKIDEDLKAHSQGGTNTLQRNLVHIFAWLEEVYDHPNPYTTRLSRYAPSRSARPRWRRSSSRTFWK